MQFIRQGATHKVVLGPAVAVGDGFTPVTNLTLSGADEAEVILHDNGTVVDISGYTWAAITTADGYYHLTLQSGISNTVGHMTVVVNDDSLVLPLRADFCVVEEAVYDQFFAGSAPGAATVANQSTIIGYIDTEVAAILAAVDTEVAAILADTAELQGDWANGGRLDLILDAAAAIMTTQLTESYRSLAAAPTPAQALFELLSHMGYSANSGTTKTIKKLSDGTSAKTFTYDSATTPTSITEAS